MEEDTVTISFEGFVSVPIKEKDEKYNHIRKKLREIIGNDDGDFGLYVDRNFYDKVGWCVE